MAVSNKNKQQYSTVYVGTRNMNSAELEWKNQVLKKIKYIIEKLKYHSAPGKNDMNLELFKLAGKNIVKEIKTIISEIWRNEQILNDWKTEIICLIFMKRDTELSKHISVRNGF